MVKLKFARYRMCCCIRKSKTDKFFLQTFKNVRKEFDVSNVYKRLNILEGALRDLFNRKKWEQAQSNYALYQVANNGKIESVVNNVNQTLALKNSSSLESESLSAVSVRHLMERRQDDKNQECNDRF